MRVHILGVSCRGEGLVAMVGNLGEYVDPQDFAIGQSLHAFFLGVRLMLATWPVCEVCDGTGRGPVTEGGYGKFSRNPCPCCEGDGEEPWQ